jgi:aquaporin Z
MKQYVCEAIGTFFIALSVMRGGNPFAIGFMIMALVYLGRAISGGYFNPALTMTAVVARRMSIEKGLFYMLSQVIGATVGAFLFGWLVSASFIPDVVVPAILLRAFTIEALLTLLICWVVLTSIRDRDDFHAASMIGVSFFAALFIGGSFNPAVSIGAYIGMFLMRILNVSMEIGMNDILYSSVVYVGAPLVGAACAAFVYRYFNSNEQRIY